MLKPEQCKEGTRVIWKSKVNNAQRTGTIIRRNGVIVFRAWSDNSDCVWVNLDIGGTQPISLEVLNLETTTPQPVEEVVTANPKDSLTLTEQEREAVMLLLSREAVMLLQSLGYTITKSK